MSPARRPTAPDDPSTRDALMDAALEQLGRNGVLAGLNLREVADRVGVTPANIYYYFESKQGLLRAALAREAKRLEAPVAEAATKGFVDRRVAMFDAITANPTLGLTALLALDGDPGYEPLPFLAETMGYYRDLVDRGELDAEVDIEALHLLLLATSIGVAIYLEPAARQLGTDADDLRARTRAAFAHLLAPAPQPER